jgi:hypothetical protein
MLALSAYAHQFKILLGRIDSSHQDCPVRYAHATPRLGSILWIEIRLGEAAPRALDDLLGLDREQQRICEVRSNPN